MLKRARQASVGEMAAAEKIDSGYLGRILHLTLLAPDRVEAVLDGMQPADLALPAFRSRPVGSDSEAMLALPSKPTIRRRRDRPQRPPSAPRPCASSCRRRRNSRRRTGHERAVASAG